MTFVAPVHFDLGELDMLAGELLLNSPFDRFSSSQQLMHTPNSYRSTAYASSASLKARVVYVQALAPNMLLLSSMLSNTQ